MERKWVLLNESLQGQNARLDRAKSAILQTTTQSRKMPDDAEAEADESVTVHQHQEGTLYGAAPSRR